MKAADPLSSSLTVVDHTHTATPELLNDAVMPDGLAYHSGDVVFRLPHLTNAASASQRRTALGGACRSQNTCFMTVNRGGEIIPGLSGLVANRDARAGLLIRSLQVTGACTNWSIGAILG
jgi:hypothetical protein